MRKFLNRIVPAFALSAIVTATAAYAAAAPVEQKLPESWQKPANVIIYDMSDYDMSYSYNFTLKTRRSEPIRISRKSTTFWIFFPFRTHRGLPITDCHQEN